MTTAIAVAVARNSVARQWTGKRFHQVAANVPRYEPTISHSVSSAANCDLVIGTENTDIYAVDSAIDKAVQHTAHLTNLLWLDKDGNTTEAIVLNSLPCYVNIDLWIDQVECRGNYWYLWLRTANGAADTNGNTYHLVRIVWNNRATLDYTATTIQSLTAAQFGTARYFAPFSGSWAVSEDGSTLAWSIYSKDQATYKVPVWYSEDYGTTVTIIYELPGTVGSTNHGHGISLGYLDDSTCLFAIFGDTAPPSGAYRLDRPPGWVANGTTNLWDVNFITDAPLVKALPVTAKTSVMSGESNCAMQYLNPQSGFLGQTCLRKKYALDVVLPSTMRGGPVMDIDGSSSQHALEHDGTVYRPGYTYSVDTVYGDILGWLVTDNMLRKYLRPYRIATHTANDAGINYLGRFWNNRLWSNLSSNATGGANKGSSWKAVRVNSINALRLERASSCSWDSTDNAIFSVASTGAATVGNWTVEGDAVISARNQGGLFGEPCLYARIPYSNDGTHTLKLTNPHYAYPSNCSNVGDRITIRMWIKGLTPGIICGFMYLRFDGGGINNDGTNGTAIGCSRNRVGQEDWSVIEWEGYVTTAWTNFCLYTISLWTQTLGISELLIGGFQVRSNPGFFSRDWNPPNIDGSQIPIPQVAEKATATLPSLSSDWSLYTDWQPDCYAIETADIPIRQAIIWTEGGGAPPGSLVWNAGSPAKVTVTMSDASRHNIQVDDTVVISGAAPSAYNGTFTVTDRTATTFKYALASNPGAQTAVAAVYVTKTWMGAKTAIWTINNAAGTQHLSLYYNPTGSCFVLSDGTHTVNTRTIDYGDLDQIRFCLTQIGANGARLLYVHDAVAGIGTAVDWSALTSWTAVPSGGTIDWGYSAAGTCYGSGLYYGFVLAHYAATPTQIAAAWDNPGHGADAGLLDVGTGAYPASAENPADYPNPADVKYGEEYAGGLLTGSRVGGSGMLIIG